MTTRRTATVLVLAMTAVLAACSFGPTRGTMPPPGPNGEIDPRQVPQFIGFVGQTDHIIGWVPSAFLLSPDAGDEAIPVYADDLRTLIGHSVPGKGFVPLGADPALVPQRPVQVAPSG